MSRDPDTQTINGYMTRWRKDISTLMAVLLASGKYEGDLLEDYPISIKALFTVLYEHLNKQRTGIK